MQIGYIDGNDIMRPERSKTQKPFVRRISNKPRQRERQSGRLSGQSVTYSETALEEIDLDSEQEVDLSLCDRERTGALPRETSASPSFLCGRINAGAADPCAITQASHMVPTPFQTSSMRPGKFINAVRPCPFDPRSRPLPPLPASRIPPVPRNIQFALVQSPSVVFSICIDAQVNPATSARSAWRAGAATCRSR